MATLDEIKETMPDSVYMTLANSLMLSMRNPKPDASAPVFNHFLDLPLLLRQKLEEHWAENRFMCNRVVDEWNRDNSVNLERDHIRQLYLRYWASICPGHASAPVVPVPVVSAPAHQTEWRNQVAIEDAERRRPGKVSCECGLKMQRRSLPSHRQSDRHKNRMDRRR